MSQLLSCAGRIFKQSFVRTFALRDEEAIMPIRHRQTLKKMLLKIVEKSGRRSGIGPKPGLHLGHAITDIKAPSVQGSSIAGMAFTTHRLLMKTGQKTVARR